MINLTFKIRKNIVNMEQKNSCINVSCSISSSWVLRAVIRDRNPKWSRRKSVTVCVVILHLGLVLCEHPCCRVLVVLLLLVVVLVE